MGVVVVVVVVAWIDFTSFTFYGSGRHRSGGEGGFPKKIFHRPEQ